MNRLVAKVESYDSVMFTVTEIFSANKSASSVCLWRLQGYVLDFIHLLVMSVANTPEVND